MPTPNVSQYAQYAQQTIVLPDGSSYKPGILPIVPDFPIDTTPKSEVVLGYQYKGTDISSLVSIYNSKLNSGLSAAFSSKNFIRSDGVDINYIPYSAAHSYLDGLWGESLALGYKYQGSDIDFVAVGSTPYPSKSSGAYPGFVVEKTISSGSVDLWYDSSSGYIKMKQNGTTSNLFKAHGVFLGLQGGGGGGGEGSSFNMGAFAGARGGGGGGGGGFILCYVNLKRAGYTFTVNVGSGGSYGGGSGNHACTGRGSTGGKGGDTTLKIGSTTILTAGGGSGGGGSDNGPTDESQGKGWGGSGGTCSTSSMTLYSVSTINYCNGARGGNGGSFSGYAFGIPYGSKPGDSGSSVSGYLTIPFLKDGSADIYGRTISGYTTGKGQTPSYGTDAYYSGGGGGGGAVTGTTGSARERGGYGVGGYGGTAEPATVHQSESGKSGALFILSQTN